MSRFTAHVSFDSGETEKFLAVESVSCKNEERVFHEIRDDSIVKGIHDGNDRDLVEILLKSGEVVNGRINDLVEWKSEYETQIICDGRHVYSFGYLSGYEGSFRGDSDMYVGDLNLHVEQKDSGCEFALIDGYENYQITYHPADSEVADFYPAESKVLRIGSDKGSSLSPRGFG